MSKTPTRSLTLYQIRKELAGKDAVILPEKDDGLTLVPIYLGTPSEPIPGRLYYKQPVPAKPKWVRFFESYLPPDLEQCRNSNWPAILLVEVDGVTFALPFSGGHHLLEAGTWSRTFGLRTALNLIVLDRIRSLDKKNFGGLHKNSREQATQAADLDNFGINPAQDLIRTISGRSARDKLASSVTGAASLRFSAKVSPSNLVPKIRKFYQLSKREDYKEEYPWIGTIAEVHHPDEVGYLDLLMEEKFWDDETCSLAAPEIIDWTEFEGFRFIVGDRNRVICGDMDVRHLKQLLGNDDVEIENFKRFRVELLDANHQTYKRWKLYDCVNFEVDEEGRHYVLSGGSWYEIDRDLLKAVDQEIASIPKIDLGLPEYEDEIERDYVERAASVSGGFLANLDRKTIWHGGGKSQIEFCDLASSKGHLIHVKNFGSPEGLSHLFNQAVTVAELLKGDSNFRMKAAEHIASIAPGLGLSLASLSDLDFVIAIVFPPGRASKPLPLFARINLRGAYRRMKIAGFRLHLCAIEREYESWLLKKARKRARGRSPS